MFNTIIVQPLLNLLFFIYAIIPGHDFGVAVILLTVLVRLALWPLAHKQLHSQKQLNKIQPEVNKLKEKYKDDPQKFNMAVMELYKEKEVNPFSSCLPTLLQLPILFGFFYVFRKFSNPAFLQMANQGIVGQIYPFIQNSAPVKSFIASTSQVNTSMFGIINLAKPSIFLGIAAGITQFVQTKMLTPKVEDKSTAAMTNSMLYIFPVLTVAISLTLPAALPLYWTVMTLVAIFQQYLIMNTEVEDLEEKSERNKPKKSRRAR